MFIALARFQYFLRQLILSFILRLSQLNFHLKIRFIDFLLLLKQFITHYLLSVLLPFHFGYQYLSLVANSHHYLNLEEYNHFLP